MGTSLFPVLERGRGRLMLTPFSLLVPTPPTPMLELELLPPTPSSATPLPTLVLALSTLPLLESAPTMLESKFLARDQHMYGWGTVLNCQIANKNLILRKKKIFEKKKKKKKKKKS